MSYTPNPMDTRHIALPDGVQELTERLAENTHEVWASQRIGDGWRFGPRRDDDKKEHPGLRPYAELTKAEKEYDRRTALETLKVIIGLGYIIKKQ